MIDRGLSFRRDIIPHILNKLKVVNVPILIEYFLNDSDFLSRKKTPKRVQIQVKAMRTHQSGIIRIKLLDISIAGI